MSFIGDLMRRLRGEISGPDHRSRVWAAGEISEARALITSIHEPWTDSQKREAARRKVDMAKILVGETADVLAAFEELDRSRRGRTGGQDSSD